ncbi:MAG: hypothetical protein AB1600_03045 [Bacteroidota bacterium]
MDTKYFFAAILFAFVAAGCSKDSDMTSSSGNETESILTLNPVDNASSVRLDAPVTLTFAKSVDRATVERGFHLISERAMADSLCPVSQMMGHGNMMDTMTDSSKMHHLDQYHMTQGKFTWKSDSTQCTFKPDSMMSPKTQYMMHIDRDMTQMMEQRMGNMGIMGGHGTGMMSGDMVFHFTTLDTTSTSGGGHNGHH